MKDTTIPLLICFVNEDGKIISGESINSYYAAYSLPVCEIREGMRL